MAECKQEVFEFQAHGSRKVTADFSGGYLSSEGGAVFLRGVDLRMGLIERVAGCFSDYRLPCLVEHKVAEILRQRIGALALGLFLKFISDFSRRAVDRASIRTRYVGPCFDPLLTAKGWNVAISTSKSPC